MTLSLSLYCLKYQATGLLCFFLEFQLSTDPHLPFFASLLQILESENKSDICGFPMVITHLSHQTQNYIGIFFGASVKDVLTFP